MPVALKPSLHVPVSPPQKWSDSQQAEWRWLTSAVASFPEELKEIYLFRELLGRVIWRDLTTRYRQTLLGVGWALVQPISMMLVLTVFVGRFMHASSGGTPYALFSLISLACFQYFSAALNRASLCLMGAAGNMIKKVYFPRVILPLASITLPFVDFVIALLALALLMVPYHISPTPRLLLLPLFVALLYSSALATALWSSALCVRYRDINHIIPFALQAAMFASPIAYSSSIIPNGLRPLYELNFLVGIMDGFRWCLLGSTDFSLREIVLSTCMITILLVTGACYFRSAQGTIADLV